MKIKLLIMFLLIPVFLLSGCGGVETYPVSARAGDTVSIQAGWRQNFEKDNISITITPSVGVDIIYPAGDPAINAVINLYPDPVSKIVVGRNIDMDTGFDFGSIYGGQIEQNYTNYETDWWQTIVFLNLPESLPVGQANITINGNQGESYGPVPVNIIDGIGTPNPFKAQGYGPLNNEMRRSLGRADHYTVKFDYVTGADTSVVPWGIELQFTHDPDSSVGGIANTRAFVVNPSATMKSVLWDDDGTNLKVVLVPVGDSIHYDAQRLVDMGLKFYKFYVAGNITGLSLQNVKAFDSMGNPLTSVIATIE